MKMMDYNLNIKLDDMLGNILGTCQLVGDRDPMYFFLIYYRINAFDEIKTDVNSFVGDFIFDYIFF